MSRSARHARQQSWEMIDAGWWWHDGLRMSVVQETTGWFSYPPSPPDGAWLRVGPFPTMRTAMEASGTPLGEEEAETKPSAEEPLLEEAHDGR
jgi:hypothetical protein